MRKWFVFVIVLVPLLAFTKGLTWANDQEDMPDEKALAISKAVEILNSARKKEARLQAARWLSFLGTAAKSAVPDLGKRLREDAEDAVVMQAAATLAAIGPAAIEELATSLESKRLAVKRYALWALAKLGPEAKNALLPVRLALQDKFASVRGLAAYALGEMNCEGSVFDLCKALFDTDASVRQRAALALQQIGPAALPGLQELMDRADNVSLRYEAIQALAIVGLQAKEALPLLIKALKDPEPQLRGAAARGLGRLGEAAVEAIPALLVQLKDKHLEPQLQAFDAIRAIGSVHVEGLIEALRKANDEGEWAAPLVLRQFGPKARDAVKPLVKALEAPEAGLRLGAVLALGQLGPEAKDAAPELEKLLNDPNPIIRAGVAGALKRINTDLEGEIRDHMRKSLEVMQARMEGLLWRMRQRKKLEEQRFGWLASFRPVDWQGFANPVLQDDYFSLVHLHLFLSAQNKDPHTKKFENFFLNMWEEAGPEALPGLIAGLNVTARYSLGFC